MPFSTCTSRSWQECVFRTTWSTLLLYAEDADMFQSFRSTTWSSLQVAGWSGNKMQGDSLKNDCPHILALSSSLSTTAISPVWLKNLGHLGRRRIAWSRRAIMLWLAVGLLTSWFRATLSIISFFLKISLPYLQRYGPNRSWKKHCMLLVLLESLISLTRNTTHSSSIFSSGKKSWA